MSLPDTKIVGYLLLGLGLIQIVYSGVNIYQVFTHRAQPIQVFNAPGVSVDLTTLLPPGLPQNPSAQKTELISPSLINEVSNLTAHYLLMSFLAGLGFKVSSLGIQLLRPIEVKLRSEAKLP